MSKKPRLQKRRHRLLVYYRISRRWLAMPLLTALILVGIYAMAWLNAYGRFEGGDQMMLARLWADRTRLLALIGLLLLLYALIAYIGRSSYVEARPRALRVKAGLLPLNISYARIKGVKLGQVGMHYRADELSNRDYALLAPMLHLPCTIVEMKSWPKEPIRRLWHKFLFTRGGDGLLFIVEDAMLLNQQIDDAQVKRMAAYKGQGRYQDPIERAAEMSRRAGRG